MSEDDSDTYTYQGLEVGHRDNDEAPELYVLTSEAYELTDWAEVPRANPDFMDGYQRQLEEHRLSDIRDFFKTDVNIIPGAILVTVRRENLSIDDRSDSVEITIESPPEKDLEELLQEAYEELYARLEDRGQEYVDSIGKDESNPESEEKEPDEEDQPVSYLARKTGELKQKVEEFDELDTKEKDNLREYVRRIQKPGKIIDGQHRVFGAKKYPESIRYPVVLIPGLEDKEQVYHFYMINDKAEPISQEELLITVVTALSEKESDNLMDRLVKAGVDVEEARYPYLADVEQHSPFHQMINYEEKVGEQTGVIDFKDMHMLMNRFVNMKGGYKPLYENIDEWAEDTRFRIEKFYTFWHAIKDHYEDLWEDAESSVQGQEFEGEYPEQFFQKDAMRVLQDYILDELTDKQESRTDVLDELEDEIKETQDLWEFILEDDEVFKNNVKGVLEDIPSDFYRRKWQTSGLSTSENRNNFREELEKAAGTTPKGIPQLRIFNQGF